VDLGLSGRTAIVCGASAGIGLGIAESLAAEGANVVMFARSPDVLELEGWTVEEVGQRAHVSNRFLVHDEDGWFRLEQEGFVDVLGGRITSIDLLSSGFERVDVLDLVAR
jgi:NAD(P)-dependent dehydrogenase (short-subunit alcohol dehydrogenase family)